MKDFIVLIASVLLGVFIFNIIMGSGNDSIISLLIPALVGEVNRRNYVRMVDMR